MHVNRQYRPGTNVTETLLKEAKALTVITHHRQSHDIIHV